MMLTKRQLAEEQGDQTSSLLSVNPSELPFSAKNFIPALVKFIVVDDQVSGF